MKILYLDTSSKYLSLAVAEESRVLAQIHRKLDRKHSLQLVPLIEQILKKAQVPLRKIDGFCVGKGPGSFTGLRIGITTIKGLAFALQKPVVAIPSLDILVQNIKKMRIANEPKPAAYICPIVDAKQNKIYSCLYQWQNGGIKRKSAYLLLTLDELLKRLKGEVIFLGDAVSLYRQKILSSKEITPILAKEKHWYPKADQAVDLALKRLQNKEYADVNSLVPLYLYPKECQVRNRKVTGR